MSEAICPKCPSAFGDMSQQLSRYICHINRHAMSDIMAYRDARDLSSAGLRENIWHQEVQDAVRGFLSAQDRITQAAMEYVADKITLEEFRNRSYIIPNDGINPLIKR